MTNSTPCPSREPFEYSDQIASGRFASGLATFFKLRRDPFERADHNAIYYNDWLLRRVFLLVPAQGFVAQWIQSFKDFPPSQKPASFNLDAVMRQVTAHHQ